MNKIEHILQPNYLDKYKNGIEEYKTDLLQIKAKTTDLNEELYTWGQNLMSKESNNKSLSTLQILITEQINNYSHRIRLIENKFNVLFPMYDDLKLLVEHVLKNNNNNEISKQARIKTLDSILKLPIIPSPQPQPSPSPPVFIPVNVVEEDAVKNEDVSININDTGDVDVDDDEENDEISNDNYNHQYMIDYDVDNNGTMNLRKRTKSLNSLYPMDEYIDLENKITPAEIVNKLKFEFEKYKITMTDFANYVLGIQRQTAYTLMRQPRKWCDINAPTKSHYKKMYAWLMDENKLDRLPHKISEDTGTSVENSSYSNSSFSKKIKANTSKVLTNTEMSEIKDLTDYYASKITDEESRLIETDITTKEIIKKLNDFLELHKIPRIFISNAFTRKSQSRLCDIINHPKTWADQPKSIRREFKSLYLWLNDDEIGNDNQETNLSLIRNYYLNKNIKYRLRLTNEQRKILNNFFQKQKYPSHEDLLSLSKKTNIDYKMIYRWFATKRVQFKINKNTLLSSAGTSLNDEECSIKNEHTDLLNHVYDNNPDPTIEFIERLSDQLGLSIGTITKWFSEKRGDTEYYNSDYNQDTDDEDDEDVYNYIQDNDDNTHSN